MAVLDRALLILMVGETVWILYRIHGHKKNDGCGEQTRLKRAAAPHQRPVV